MKPPISAVDAAAMAIAAVEGDPELLHQVSTANGLTRVPAWWLYRVRARKALEAAREALVDGMDTHIEREGRSPGLDLLRDAFDEAIAP